MVVDGSSPSDRLSPKRSFIGLENGQIECLLSATSGLWSAA
jgi:hypothetical protein